VTERFQAKFAQRTMTISNKYHVLKTVFRLVEEIFAHLPRLLLQCTSRTQRMVREDAAKLVQPVDFDIENI
jgi:hypothetical protein